RRPSDGVVCLAINPAAAGGATRHQGGVMPARSADDVRVETYGGPRDSLRALFELAEDSAAGLDSYIDAGRVLVAVADGEVIGHLQLTGTGDRGRWRSRTWRCARTVRGRAWAGDSSRPPSTSPRPGP